MSALPRPDLPPGAHRDLVVELHELHHRDGWRSLRTLARETGVSHTTVSKAFSASTLPSWGVVELLVEAMGGDPATFHAQWLAATAPVGDTGRPATAIAGRRPELDVVRRHLSGGQALLLVTGEAGMGKTTVVEAACAGVQGDVLVAQGRCLPLSTEVALLPVAEALRQASRVEDGRVAEAALQKCPTYVREALSSLLPEWSTGDAPPEPDDRWLRQRLFAGVAELCRALTAERPMALVLEDLHWADDLTLDLVEHLARHGQVRLLGSWRTDDPDVSAGRQDWFNRVRRDAALVALGSLTEDETLEQLRCLRPDASPQDAARIHERSRGLPLFTEQLAHAEIGEPTYLDDLLDGRVDHLAGPQWAVASVLGVADRALDARDLARAADVEEATFTGVLRELTERRLVAVDAGGVQLRHPLLAEAVRRRLLTGEAAAAHRSVAMVLAAADRPGTAGPAEPAEVAQHWQGAGEPDEELVWRVRAARAAAARYAGAHAADHWQRALGLWPHDAAAVGDPPVRRHEVVAGITTQLDLAGRARDAVPVLEAELALPELAHLYEVDERADLLRHLARLNSSQFVVGDLGLLLVDQAIELYRTLPPSPGLVTALTWKGIELEWHGRRAQATDVLAEAARTAAETGDRLAERSVLAQWAWQLGASGEVRSVDEIERVFSEFGEDANPLRTLWVAIRHTDILLMACRPAEDIARAARPALEQAARWSLTGSSANVLRSNVAQAWRRAGMVGRAMDVIAAETTADTPRGTPYAHVDRAVLEVLLGNDVAARRRIGSFDLSGLAEVNAFILEAHLSYAIWMGDPAVGLDLAKSVLTSRHDEVSPGLSGELLLLTAAAAADASAAGPQAARQAARRTLDAIRDGLHHDPFAPAAVLADRAARPQWDAETQRVLGHDTVEAWLEAATTWHELDRPHDTAYCQWRAAQAALRDGRGSAAAGLLRRAASQAREHLPLARAIADTAAGT